MYHLYDLEVDEEKKVEAVRDFYAQAAKNETAFSSAERMLFFGIVSLSQICVIDETIITRFVNLCFYMSSYCFQLELVCLSLSLRSQQFTGDMDSRCTWRRTNQLVFKYTLYFSPHYIIQDI